MAVAVGVERSPAVNGEPYRGILLRIELYDLNPIRSHKREKRDEMRLLHRVLHGYIKITLNVLRPDQMLRIVRLSLQGGSCTPQQLYAPSPVEKITFPQTGQT